MLMTYDLAIVGVGLSTLSAIAAGPGSEQTAKQTIVFDYQDAPGGFLRAALPAPGLETAWELIQSTRIPQEITVCFGATVVGLLPAFEPGESHTLMVRQRQGTVEVSARRVLIACGGLEVTRERAQIPGTRPAGVMTPIMVHQLLFRGYLPGRQAVVYGNARYTKATAQRLMNTGIEVSIVDPLEAEIVAIDGFPRLQQVMLRRGGQSYDVPADLLVYGAGMMANTHWLKGSGINTGLDGSIQVDAGYQTNVPGIYAAGTVVSPSLDHADSFAMGKEVASLFLGEAL